MNFELVRAIAPRSPSPSGELTRAPAPHVPAATTSPAPALILASAEAAPAASHRPAPSVPGEASRVDCAKRVQLSRDEEFFVAKVRVRLEGLRDIRGKESPYPQLDYGHRVTAIAESIVKEAPTPRARLKAVELLRAEALALEVQRSIGPSSSEYRRFVYEARRVRVANSPDMAPMAASYERLVRSLEAHFEAKLRGTTDTGQRLALIEQRAQAREVVHAVAADLQRTALENVAVVDERERENLALMKQVAIATGGAVIFVGALALSGKLVAAAAVLGVAGQVGAAGLLGGAGGGAVALLEGAYEAVSHAIVDAFDNDTAFACELRNTTREQAEGLAGHVLGGVGVGMVAGLGLGGLAVYFPKPVIIGVAAAVGVSLTYEVGMVGVHLYDAKQLWERAEAELAKGREAEARAALALAREQARQAGHAALDAAIVGVLAVALGGELAHAMKASRQEVMRMIAASSDEVPAAAKSTVQATKAGLKAAGVVDDAGVGAVKGGLKAASVADDVGIKAAKLGLKAAGAGDDLAIGAMKGLSIVDGADDVAVILGKVAAKKGFIVKGAPLVQPAQRESAPAGVTVRSAP